MKLSGMFRIGFVAAIVTALILLPSCIAPRDKDKASTSTSQPSSHSESTKLPWPPTHVNEYIDYLNVNNIEGLSFSPLDQEARTFGNVPFFYLESPKLRTPLYSIDTATGTVEQALRDHGSVGIVDASNNLAKLIQFSDGRLAQGLFPDVQPEPIQLFKLDPALHHLRQLARHPDNNMPPQAEIEYLPHFDNKPILSQGSENLGHMLQAAGTDPRSFYYFQEGMDPILVVPDGNMLIVNPIEDEKRKLRDILKGYQTAKKNYGQTVATIIWGKPIRVSADPHGLRKSSVLLEDYPRFKHDAPKRHMMTALQRNGRFRVYKEIDGKKYGYKVKMKNPEAVNGETLQVEVNPLTSTENVMEKALIRFGKIRLP
ncbi:hypothetical protein NDA10_003004 [Ustilago hordei]|uniref:Conserved uncharacterized protein n=1 Tax=Ustilago hordei TaxID=120017 RepID=I2FRB8_USTHO|nr:uncharacterized protein UHO2_05585 [Ustilago hordei]KAJ1042717.1 hypothetical protein NDA10_003004 [Ustilago hordei]KAJ1572722.1 hypothetical protein NDA15_001959 [Ustilago hordei]KAJ1575666.1 hypothetical protein NDA12_001770 [Ustilago hordei]CCF49461.1 conserved uncharacterized protein [Ustilago hordei]SYW76868.1 uncharacterized protein UHO2_05585 [Ustilago hordei]